MWTTPDMDGVVEELPIPEPSDLEERAGVDSLEALQTRRRMIIENNTRLFALYGAFGHYDDHRKHMVEALQVKARMDLSGQQRPKPPTVDEIEATAYGSEDYAKFLDTALAEKVEWLKLSTEITEIEEAIRTREIELRAYTAEIGLR